MSEIAAYARILNYQPGERVSVNHQVRPGGEFTSRIIDTRNLGAAVDNATNQACYWIGVNPTNATTGRGKEKDASRLAALYCELDDKNTTEAQQTAIIANLGDLFGSPSMIVHSGHGVHLYWPIRGGDINDWFTPKDATQLLKRFGRIVTEVAAKHGAGEPDPVWDLVRVLRLPGTVNYKNIDEPIPVRLTVNEAGHDLTVAEAATHLDAADALHPPPAPKPAIANVVQFPRPDYDGESIAERYKAEHTWADILEPHGWRCRTADPDADGAIWLHPTHTSDCSATIKNGCLFVYSPNTPFEVTTSGSPHGYTKFHAYAVLNHGGDMSAAAKALMPPPDYGRTDFDPDVLMETDDAGQPTEDAKDALDAAIRNRALQLRIDKAAKKLVDAEDRPKVEHPPVRSLTALLAQPCPPTRWRIEQVAPIEARTILAAQFKAGKTTLTGNLIRSLVDREDFLGRFAIAKPADNVVLIDDELSEYMVQDWLGRQNIRNTDALADVVTLRGKLASFDLFDDDCRAEWAQRFRNLGCDYLILDCLRPILDAFGLDENRDVGRFLVQFDAMLEAAGIRDALLIHHMGHQGERSRGDSRLLDWPDVNWRIIREDADDPSSPRFFSAYGRDVTVPEGRLSFNETTRHLTYVDGSRGDAKTEAALQAVLTVLAADARSGGKGLSGRAVEFAVSDEHTQKATRAALKLAARRELTAKAPGERNATLHRIAQPCSMCGHPLAAGQGTRHEECAREVAA
ncbi:AAA family ATPase [Mycobacterium sp. pUA109]|uniref:AAA family ATPase n=1 Tax=Mycobacterium sp. pUA109 TaxID=3238982 RepID=UPI00351BD37B